MEGKKMLFAAWSAKNKNYFGYQTWDTPLRKRFPDMAVFDPQEETYKYGKEEMNKRFLEVVKKEQPDYIFLWLIYEEFYIDTLLKAKELCPKAKMINFCGDDDLLFHTYSIHFSHLIDYYLVSHKEFIPHYHNTALLSCATNTDLFRPLGMEKKYDVSFVGTPKRDRMEFVKHLMDNGIKVRVFGGGWQNYPEFKEIYGGFLSPDEYNQVVNQTKVNLCFTKNYVGTTHVIQKFFEINSCKVFSLTEYCTGYAELFKNKKELVMFKTKEELLKEVKYYLKHEKEREKIADASYKRILADFSKDMEFDKLFKLIKKDEKKTPKKAFPKINKKSFKLLESDLLDEKKLKEKLKNIDYISFKTKYGESLPYKEYLHMAALENSKKEISCSDYYVNSKRLGDYLALYIQTAFKDLGESRAQELLNLDQIMVTKKFFLKNLGKFKKYFKGEKIDFLKKENTAFVAFPLARVKKTIPLNYEDLKKISWQKFEISVKSLNYRKKLISNNYMYNVFNEYLAGNKFVLKYLLEKAASKNKLLSTLTN